MNWNTKAKTRLGRGKSKVDVENQQRLAAWNKSSKNRSSKRAESPPRGEDLRMGHGLPMNRYPAQSQSRKYGTSGDLLMLGDVPVSGKPPRRPSMPEVRVTHPQQRFCQPPEHTRLRSKSSDDDDPLKQLQFTPEKEKRSFAYSDVVAGTISRPAYDLGIVDEAPMEPILQVMFFNDGHMCHEVSGLPVKRSNSNNGSDFTDYVGSNHSQKSREHQEASNLTDSKQSAAAFANTSPNDQKQHGGYAGITARKKFVPHNMMDDFARSPQSSKGLKVQSPKMTQKLNSYLKKQSTAFIEKDELSNGNNYDDMDKMLTEFNWWSRFLSLIDSTTLVRNVAVVTFLSDDIDLLNPAGDPPYKSPKPILLALYRALNQLSISKLLSAENVTALCDAIRFLELVDKQLCTDRVETEKTEVSGDEVSPKMPSTVDKIKRDRTQLQPSRLQSSLDNRGWDLFGGAISFGKVLPVDSRESRSTDQSCNEDINDCDSRSSQEISFPAETPANLGGVVHSKQESRDKGGSEEAWPSFDVNDEIDHEDSDFLQADFFLQ